MKEVNKGNFKKMLRHFLKNIFLCVFFKYMRQKEVMTMRSKEVESTGKGGTGLSLQ